MQKQTWPGYVAITVIFGILLLLKLSHFWEISWWWVLLPVWFPVAALIFGLLCFAIAHGFAQYRKRQQFVNRLGKKLSDVGRKTPKQNQKSD